MVLERLKKAVGAGEHGYSVHRYDPARRRVQVLLILAAIIVTGVVAYEFGSFHSGYLNNAYKARIGKLEDEVDELEDNNNQLLSDVALLQRSSQVEKQAAFEVNANQHELESQVMELKEELSFYKSIISPSEMKPGLHVQSFNIENGETSHEYLYKLVLTQVRGQNRVARGMVDLLIDGEQDGEPRSLHLANVSNNGVEQIAFAFKYFQSVEGSMVFPEGFKPSTIQIRVTPKSRRLESIEQSYSWESAFSGGA